MSAADHAVIRRVLGLPPDEPIRRLGETADTEDLYATGATVLMALVLGAALAAMVCVAVVVGVRVVMAWV